MTLFSSVPGTFVLVVGVVMTGVVAPSVVAQAPPGFQGIDTLTSTRDSLLVTYEEGATVVVELEGTSRLPEGEGRAEVRRRPGVTEIDIRLDKMKPATLFGGDFSTYVLWTVSPEGRAVNVGEFLLDSEESELRVSSPLDMFGLFVTFEPHALVTMPSRFVVLDNTGVGVQRGRTTTRSVQYQGFDGVYEFERESLLRQPAARGRQRVERQQAVIAVALAERAGAATYAPDELRTAADALGRTVAAFERGASQAERTLLAHETVRLAMGAREVAVTRAAEAALEAERQAARDEIDALARARQEAEAAAARVQALRAEAQREAEEAKAAATQLTQLRDEAETQAERDRLAAEDARQAQQAAVSAQAAAEAATREAQLEQQAARALAEQAQLESARLEDLRAEAETQAERARREAADARTRMENALGRVADTQQTARGVIVNLSDILFETGQAVLRPQAPRGIEPHCRRAPRGADVRAQHRGTHRCGGQRRLQPTALRAARRQRPRLPGGSTGEPGCDAHSRVRQGAAGGDERHAGRAPAKQTRGDRDPERRHARRGITSRRMRSIGLVRVPRVGRRTRAGRRHDHTGRESRSPG